MVSNGGFDLFLVKFNSGGNLVWGVNWGGLNNDIGFSMLIDTDTAIYVTGKFLDTVDFDPGVGIHNLTSNPFGDTFFAKYDNFGFFKWVGQFNGTEENAGRSILVDKYNLYIAGGFAGTCDFDPTSNFYNLSANGNYDGYVVKLSTFTKSIPDFDRVLMMNALPNPFSSTFQIKLMEKSTVLVSTLTGQIVLKTVLPEGLQTINFSNQESGSYLLKVYSDKVTFNTIIIKAF